MELATKTQPKKKVNLPGKDGRGRFAKGNHHAAIGGKVGKFKRAQAIMDEHGFDPLKARVVYHIELMDEASRIKGDLANGMFMDITGNLVQVLDMEKDKVTILDMKHFKWAHDKYAAIRREADQVAASLMNYVYPQLKAIEVDPGTEGTWAAIVAVLAEAKGETPEAKDG